MCTVWALHALVINCGMYPVLHYMHFARACYNNSCVSIVRGGSRISDRGGGGGGGGLLIILIFMKKCGRGSGTEPQPPMLFHYIMRTTLHNVMILPCHLFARRAAVVLRISATLLRNNS